jgi:hypothetical protein
VDNLILNKKHHEVIDSANTILLEILYSVASDFNNGENNLNAKQLDELKRRLALSDSAEMRFSTWE